MRATCKEADNYEGCIEVWSQTFYLDQIGHVQVICTLLLQIVIGGTLWHFSTKNV